MPMKSWPINSFIIFTKRFFNKQIEMYKFTCKTIPIHDVSSKI